VSGNSFLTLISILVRQGTAGPQIGLIALVTLACSQLGAAPPQRLDPYGDPLPPGAIVRFGTRRFWSGGAPVQVAFSPDGSKIVATAGHGVFICDTKSGKQLGHISTRERQRSINSSSVSSDGTYLALGTDGAAPDEGGVEIWDAQAQRLMHDCRASGELLPVFWSTRNGSRLPCGL
jgi:WD40 repeat protein